MAKISLRSYTHEIEGQIERGQIDEAIAHCRHILQFFPKHIDTYRLLGKAYLESQRYGDAADILQRVLSSVPDDFVAQVGMSIIREDEGNLDEAIWHMERAFEVQPANRAIQEELSRLYGRRDGVEPPKVRLTRGALARMYAKGDLYQQAIAELRAGLAEDPHRIDLQVLLGKVYFLSGQRVDAAEICSAVIRKLPYCLEVNRILADLLANERAEESQAYRQRVRVLDPYAGQTSPAAPTAEQVPDQAVMVEKLIYKPGLAAEEKSSQPEWAASLGVQVDNLGQPQEKLPDWLSAAGVEKPKTGALAFEEPEAQPAASEDIPDWMKAAGWGTATAAALEAEKQQAFSDIEDDSLEDLAQADVPDWLREIAPPGETEEPAAALKSKTEEPDLPDWVSKPPEKPEEEDNLPDWLDEKEERIEPQAAELPDWLQSLGGAEPASTGEQAFFSSAETASNGALKETTDTPAGDDVPDWLKDMRGSDEFEIEAGAEMGDLPDWLKEAAPLQPIHATESATPVSEEPEAVKAELPDWLAPAEDMANADTAIFESTQEAEPVEAELPDWLTAEAQPEEVVAEEPEAVEAELPDGLATSAIAGAGATIFESTTEPEPLIEAPIHQGELPDWLESPIEEALPDASLPGKPEQALAEEAVEADLSDDDAAFAWLENLAVKQGATEALLLTPEERLETPPEWVQETVEGQVDEPVAAAEVEAEAEAIVPVGQMEQAVEEEIEPPQEAAPAETAAAPDWLQAIQEAKTPEAEPGEMPEWLKETLPASVEPDEQSDEAALPDWLSQETLEPADAEMPDWLRETIPSPISEEEVADEAETPDWLAETFPIQAEVEAPETQIPELAAVEAELPDWLKETIQVQGAPEPEAIAEPAAEFELPEWEASMPEETAETQPVQAAELEESPANDLSEDDAAFAWLESLAVKQGATEALLLPPEERLETPPDWIQDTAESQPLEPAPVESDLSAEEMPVADLSHAEAEALVVESEPEAQPAPMPDWLEAMPTPSEMLEEAFSEADESQVGVSEAEEAEAMAGELPDWLQDITPVQSEAVEAELPEWLLPIEEASKAVFTPTEAKSEPHPDLEDTKPIRVRPRSETEEGIVSESPVEAPAAEIPVPPIEAEPEEALIPIEAEMEAAAEPAETDLTDEDAAFAWLESLAVKQGATEALLLPPEERLEAPPEWIQEAAEEAPETLPAVELEESAEVEAELPAVEVFEQAVVQEAQPPQPTEPEMPDWLKENLLDDFISAPPAQPVSEEAVPVPDWLSAAEAEVADSSLEAQVEAPPEEEAPEAVTPVSVPESPMPELPSWLQEGPVEEKVTHEEWIPPVLPPRGPVPQVIPQRVDLNGASLVELERLPGIGFIRAQQILDVRERLGRFNQVEDLLQAPGMTQANLEELSPYLFVEAPETPDLPEIERTGDVAEAHSLLMSGKMNEALSQYETMIKARKHLPEIIHDLQEAQYRYPAEVMIWQLLGDAFMRNDQITEALQAYTKAEELIR